MSRQELKGLLGDELIALFIGFFFSFEIVGGEIFFYILLLIYT